MQYSYDPAYSSRRSPVFGRNIVSTSQPLAAQAGLSMLARGGNAVDAALAAAIALVVVEPTGTGLGSDAFCILWDGDRLHGLNASGRAPQGWTPDRFAGRDAMPAQGWETVTVPGGVSAWVELSRRFGRLEFAELFGPAIDYAERGFHVTPVIAEVWRRGAEQLQGEPGFAEAFMPQGRAPRAGELFACAPLARSLRLIAESRGEAFYRGELAERTADFARSHGAALTADDLAAHTPEWCGTISQGFGDCELHEIPPNGQGIAALMALGILDRLDIGALHPDSVDALHLQIEAMKLAIADLHAYVADADFMGEVSAADLLSPAYLDSRAGLLDRGRAQDYGPGTPAGTDTVYLSAADEAGMMVSFIQSNFMGFGSGVVVPETGISLHNRGSAFSLASGHPNEVGAGKRPFHTIIPGFLMRNGAPLMSFGVMGAAMQAQGHVQMVLRTQCWHQDPQTAVDAPRWRVMGGREVVLERTLSSDIRNKLIGRGHEIVPQTDDLTFGLGGAQLVTRIDGGYVAGSDPRKDGQAVAV